jgi:uncharacterized membrane protein YeaQ/YmgE (transglycosylase-associated protein family)
MIIPFCGIGLNAQVRDEFLSSVSIVVWVVSESIGAAGVTARKMIRRFFRGTAMNLSNESLIVILLVGIVAGWLAGQVVRGGGFGLVGDLIVGIIGAFVGDWLLPRLDIHLGVGIVSLIINATIGAIVLLIVIRLLAGNRGWGGGWGASRWGNSWGWGRRW